MRSIRKHLDNDVKKLGVDMLHIDVSYKGAKKLKKVNGQPIAKGLVSIMNQAQGITSQFFISTYGQE